jgi:beta-glucosidase/6-phospho-beta-glucosidase/beta-galactosidase
MLQFLRRNKVADFPADFSFGVGNSDHQCESYEPSQEDIWDVWERIRALCPRGRATEFQLRYRDDIALARGLGCTVFRLSVSWARVEPEPGRFDTAALAHYREVVEAVRDAGLEPLITLQHFVWPLHIQNRGGMTADDFPAWFTDYAAKVAETLGPSVRDWLTFNEPNLLCFGYLRPWWQRTFAFPPGLPLAVELPDQLTLIAKLIRNLFLGHARAREAIQRINPQARVGANPSLLGLPAWLQRIVDRNVTDIADPDEFVRRNARGAEKGIEHGRVDAVISSFTITGGRSRQVDFTSPYMTSGQSLLVLASSAAQRLEDVNGSVGVAEGSTSEIDAPSLLPGRTIVSLKDTAALKTALDSGKVGAVLSDEILLQAWLAAEPERYRQLGSSLTVEPYGIATPRGGGLLDPLEAALQSFQTSGAFAQSFAKHLPGQSPPQPPKVASRATLAPPATGDDAPLWRARTAQRFASRPIRIAVGTAAPGLACRDPATGAWSGLEVDLARYVAAYLLGDETRLQLVPTTTSRRLPLLQTVASMLQRILEPLHILSTCICTNWWHLGMAGRLPEFLCPQEAVGRQDFVGLDYYWGLKSLQIGQIGGLIEGLTRGSYSAAPVWSGGLDQTLNYHANMFPGRPIMIVENGCVDEAGKTSREIYFKEHLRVIQRALGRGVNVEAFIAWSITTNREWGSQPGPGSDFGLYHIDLDNDPALTRTPTPAADGYRQVISRRGVD